jgi:hypothetical protein
VTYDHEVVPDSLKFPHIFCITLALKYLCEQSNEE